MKRYAIEEVFYDNCVIKYMIPHKKVKCMPFQCEKCGMYGDTKEQLIKKVAQALELCMNKGYRTITSEEYAKFIVEFLGVK